MDPHSVGLGASFLAKCPHPEGWWEYILGQWGEWMVHGSS